MVPAHMHTFVKNRLYFTDNFGYIDVIINFWDADRPVRTYFVATDGTTGTDNTLMKVYAR